MFGKKSDEESARIRELARVDRFRGLSDNDLTLVVEAATYLTVPQGWALMVEQTPADKAYLILSGEVVVKRSGEEVARLGAGEVIGEMALVNHKLRNATVIAESPLEVLHFTDDTVDTLVAKIPNFREALIGASQERQS